MTDFICYTNKYIPEPSGFNNAGATCYFNALTQALLSCSSFNEVVIKYWKTFETPVGLEMVSMLKKMPKIGGNDNFDVAKALFSMAKMRRDVSCLVGGNQCCLEAYLLLIDFMKSPKIERLFTHGYRNEILCDECKTCTVTQKKCENIIFDIPADAKFDEDNIDLTDFIRQATSELVGNFKCPKCGLTKPKHRSEVLTMVPEILTIVFQAGRKPHSKIPEFLSLPGVENKKKMDFKYAVVAQIEHAGSSEGGHYWAICRRGKNWYVFNDSHVSEGQFGVTNNTFMMMYHIL